MLDPDDLVLTELAPSDSPSRPIDAGGAPRTFGAVIGDHWCFAARAFGGYTAALAVAAALATTDHDHVASASVLFLEPGRPGPIRFTVVPLRVGRTAAAMRVVARQGERTVVEATLWLADAWDVPPGAAPDPTAPPDLTRATDPGRRSGGTPAPGPRPEDGDDLGWLIDVWTMLAFGERRAIDYPDGFTSFARGRPHAELWVRADLQPETADATPERLHPQVVDLLHLDAHLFDAPGMITGFTSPDDPASGTSMISLDLNVAWQPGASRLPATAWRHLTCDGSVTSGGVTSYGSLTSVDGRRLATATSQGLARH